MTTIHPAHLKGNLAVSSLKHNLAQIGILADEIKNDYGEDLILQTNLENVADSFAIRVQVKYITFKKNRRGLYSASFSIDHLWRWISHSDPVFICLYDHVSTQYALINSKSISSLWGLATTNKKTFTVYFSDEDVITDKEKLESHVWEARVSYYSAKIAQLEANFLYGPVESEKIHKKRNDSLLLEIGVIISGFMRATKIYVDGQFADEFLKYLQNAAHNLAKDGFEDLNDAFMLSVLGRVNETTKVGLPRNLMERTTDICGHYYRYMRPKDWKKLNALYPRQWNPFGIKSTKKPASRANKS
jgi:hypothetical protein